MRIAMLALLAGLTAAWAQEIRFPASLDRLGEKAEESVDVTLNKSMLQMAARFLSGDGDEAATKKLLAGLENVTVRSFEFMRAGEYNAADVEAVRAQLQAPAWARIVGARSRHDGEVTEIYFKDGGNGQLSGIVIISTEPTSLTLVSVTGKLDPAQLADLGGHFGIPRVDLSETTWGRRGRR